MMWVLGIPEWGWGDVIVYLVIFPICMGSWLVYMESQIQRDRQEY
jgi:hypothetical protein